MKQMRDAREKNLDAARQKLSAMINARRKLDVDVQNLEAKRKLVEVAQASSDYVFDDSQLARAKELINDIRTRLDVAAKLANADVNVQTEIPLNEAAPADITDQVTQYFKLDAKVAKDTKASDEKKPEVVAASFSHEKPSSHPSIAACGPRSRVVHDSAAAIVDCPASTFKLSTLHPQHSTSAMFPTWRLRLREARVAAQSGRYDDASRVLSDESLREFLPAKRLARDVAEKMVERARDRFALGDTSAGWQDLQVADRLGGQVEAVNEVRHHYADAALLQDARKYLAAGEPASPCRVLKSSTSVASPTTTSAPARKLPSSCRNPQNRPLTGILPRPQPRFTTPRPSPASKRTQQV